MTSAAASWCLVRFCRSLGYEGLPEFKLHLAQRLAVGTPYLHRAVTSKDDTASLIHKILFGAAAAFLAIDEPEIELLAGDVYIHGPVGKASRSPRS